MSHGITNSTPKWRVVNATTEYEVVSATPEWRVVFSHEEISGEVVVPATAWEFVSGGYIEFVGGGYIEFIA